MKNIRLFFYSISRFSFSQINLRVLDENGEGVSDARINYNNQHYTTDSKGVVKIPLASAIEMLVAEKEGFKSFSKKINTSPKIQNINILFAPIAKETTIKEVVFQKKGKPKIQI